MDELAQKIAERIARLGGVPPVPLLKKVIAEVLREEESHDPTAAYLRYVEGRYQTESEEI